MNTRETAATKAASASDADYIRVAVDTIDKEASGLRALAEALRNGLGAPFCQVVELILRAKGRVIVSGIGKSGHIGNKIAATLASTGTPAQFVHATEAAHGDMGMITRDDVLLMLSNSGNTPELAAMIEYATRNRIPLVAITANAESLLGRNATHSLLLPEQEEACPLKLAPTTSTTMQLALGDALAMALMRARNFQPEDFGELHPGGSLGAMLKPLKKIMHGKAALPLVAPDTPMNTTLLEMTGKHFGTVGIVENGRLVGIITDGDLRRAMERHPDLMRLSAGEVMTRGPFVMTPDEPAGKALAKMNERQITVVFVVDETGAPVGIVHIHDLLRLEGQRPR